MKIDVQESFDVIVEKQHVLILFQYQFRFGNITIKTYINQLKNSKSIHVYIYILTGLIPLLIACRL